jgi:hypothetical protein
MQIDLLNVTIGIEFTLFFGYVLYGVLRKFASKEDKAMISFYITLLIGFITSVLILNSLLSLPRYLPGEIPIVMFLLVIDIVFFLAIVTDTIRLRISNGKLGERDAAQAEPY